MQVNAEEWLAVAKQHLHPASVFLQPSSLQQSEVVFFLPGHEDQRHEMGVKDNDDLCGHPYWRWYPEGGSSSDTRPDLLQYTEYCTISDVNYFVITEEDGTLKPVARVWLDKANKEVVYPNCNFSKPTKRYRWTKVDVHVSLGLPEFLIAKDCFHVASNQRFVHDDEVQVWRQDADSSPASKWWSGKVFVDEKGKDPCTLWKGIRVKYRDGSTTKCSAWELRRLEEPMNCNSAVHSASSSINFIGEEYLQTALKLAQEAAARQDARLEQSKSELGALHQLTTGLAAQLAASASQPGGMSGLNDMGFGQSNLPGVGSTSFGQPPSVPGMASRGFGRPANLPKVKVGPILGELAAASRATLGSVKSAGTVLGGRPGGRLGETPTSQPSGLLWDPMDTVTGRVASPVALTPDGRLQPGDPAFSFEGRDGVIRHCATSQMPAYQGVKVMLTQDGVPAFMAFMVEDDGGERPLGLYVTAEEAATARDEALLRQNGLGNRAVLNHPVDDYQHILAEFRLQRADSDELEESPMSHHDSPLLSNRASFLEHIHSLPSDPFAPKLSKFPLGEVLPPQGQLSSTSQALSSESEQTSRPPSPGVQGALLQSRGVQGALLQPLDVHEPCLQPEEESEGRSDDQHVQELGMEDWIPTKGKRGKRTTRSKKERAAVTESALGVVKKGSSSVMKKKGTEQAKKRASKLAPFKGVTIKNNRLAVMIWDRSTNKPAHLGYWECSLDAARIADKGRLCLYGRRGVRDTDLNFPADSYGDDEIPRSIEQLQAFIKHDQAAGKGAQAPWHATQKSTRKTAASTQPRQVPSNAAKWSHYIGVAWDATSGMWKAAVKSDDGGVKDLGFFVEQEDAAVAVDQHAWQVAGPQGLRNHPPSHYTGNGVDDTSAHACLKLYAEHGESWVHAHVAHVAIPRAPRNVRPPQKTGPAAAKKPTALGATAPVAEGPAMAQVPEPRRHTVKRQASPKASQPPANEATPDLHTLAPKEAPYHGLRWVAAKGKWEVGIEVQGSFKLVGLYTDAKEGATAHDAAVLVAGTDTPLNFPDEAISVSAATQQSCISLALHMRKSTALARSLPIYQAKIGGRQKKPRKRAEEEDGEEGQSQASERSRKAHRTAAADSPAPCNTRLNRRRASNSSGELSPEEEEAVGVLQTLSSGSEAGEDQEKTGNGGGDAPLKGRHKKARKRAEEEDAEDGQSEAGKQPRKARRIAPADRPAPYNTRVNSRRLRNSTDDLCSEEEEAAGVLQTLGSGCQ